MRLGNGKHKFIYLFALPVIFLTIAFATANCAFAEDFPGEKQKCNGSVSLCDRRYNEVTFPGSHNSMSNRDDGWHFPNQEHGIERQLADGIRAFMIDTYYNGGEVYMCHAFCELGMRPLEEGLLAIKYFMDEHPREVVTIDFQSAVSAGDAVAVFEKIGLDGYALAQAPGKSWPTLREMIESGQRLVVFGDGGGAASWYLPFREHAWSSRYDFMSISEFECGAIGDKPVFALQHFVNNPLPNIIVAEKVNSKRVILKRARQCWRESGQRPSYIGVDFYSVGDLFEAVDILNAQAGPEQ